ncbi:hypothetical protein SAMN04489743_0916 [Pseudarthrobacter equi]|uniref:Uncharacterized protein n=1 Tax=Pseudarthrobacter equi TaxID=728066 RepID=A0A1H1V890_9MICC|nr:ankyrin repeat domain-containing protein [Pseudarthrobacter equi]SDS80873.1 hypothetical protein SAMN04489743_0916 [Pseudarthrobacter equi]
MRRTGIRAQGLLAAGALALILTACQSPAPAPSSGPASAAPSPSTAVPTSTAVPSGTVDAQPGPPASGPAATPAALSAEAQAALDQELIAAAKANNAPLVRELVGRGGNVNAKDSIQDSAFLYAGAEGFNEVLQLTLGAGADVSSINRYGGTALIPASEHGHVETAKILVAAGVPVNHVNNLGWTAMQEAILLNNGGPRQQEVVRLLLEAGGDPGIRDAEGRTALQNAERLGFAEIAALIRSHG